MDYKVVHLIQMAGRDVTSPMTSDKEGKHFIKLQRPVLQLSLKKLGISDFLKLLNFAISALQQSATNLLMKICREPKQLIHSNHFHEENRPIIKNY